jgi:hypothetical protein
MAFTKKVSAGQDISSADFRQYFGDHFSSFVKTGFEVTDDTGLDVSVSAGTAYVKDATNGMYQVVSDAAESMTMENNTTNYIFLHSDNGATYLTSSTTATVPDDAILLASVLCAAGGISSVSDSRRLLPVTPSRGFITEANPGFTAGVSSGGDATTNTYYLYLNPEPGRIMTLKTLKYYHYRYRTGTTTIYYDIGAGPVKIRAVGATGTYTDVIDVSNAAYPTFEPYLKFVIESGNGSAGQTTAVIKAIRLSYTVE